MAKESDLQGLIRELKTLTTSQINGVFTCDFVVVEEVDHENARCKISHKDDEKVQADNVPILSSYAGDGYGTLEPIKPGDEGIAFFNMNPTDKHLKSEGHDDIEKQRRHSIQDAMFMPRPWLDPHEVPEHKPQERLVYHESGTFFSIMPNGDVTIQHTDGFRMRIDKDEGVIETKDTDKQIGVRDNGVEARVKRPDGEVVKLRAENEGLKIQSPDVQSKYVQNPETHISVDENGVAVMDGVLEIGDKDATRVNPKVENTDPKDPRTYEQVNGDSRPIQDPAKGNDYINPSTVTSVGPIGMQGFETRQFIPQRRKKDPKLNVTDPTKDEYIDLPQRYRNNHNKLPRGLMWLNTKEGALKMTDKSGKPVKIKSGL